MDVDEAADQLYALPPSGFVEARDTLVRQARAAGDRDLAVAIADLRRPTAVAWLANRLARERPDQLADFLALGVPLREASATMSGAALRDLSRQRGQLVQALVRDARQVVSGGPGPRVSEDVARGLEATLHAALADPAAAASVAAGRLSGALSHSGFGAALAQESAAAGAGTKATKTAKKTSAADRRAAQRAQIETELAQAWAAARDAADARDTAAVAATAAATTYVDMHALLRALQDELGALQERVTEAETARDASLDERNRTAATSQAAGRGADRARKVVTDLQSRLDSLSP